ncbi:hypothetical protein B0H19DRAFT_1310715 [Mycena capillaripes]|nr:hypothetical protein B0H19DRAFT_1310715 [Mycena capillaripes]
MSPHIASIIGAGKNIGEHTAAALKAKGYEVALGSRNPTIDQIKKDGYFPVVVDAHSPESVKTAFAQINMNLAPRNVVIFNEDPLTLSLESFKEHTNVGLAVYAAAQEAIRGFRSEAHRDTQKTFIVTGNSLPWVPANIPKYLGLSMKKLIEWHLMENLSSAYSKEQFRFYYVRLVRETGDILNPMSSFSTSGPQFAQLGSYHSGSPDRLGVSFHVGC